MPVPTLKSRLEAGETLYGAWLNLDSARVGEALARDGWDAVVIDMQHGLMDYRTMVGAIAGIAAAGAAPLVRCAIGDQVMLGRAPDAGASGMICPMINSGQDAAWFVRQCKYPPIGARSWGPRQAMAVHGLDGAGYLAAGNDLVTTFAMVETAQALKHIDSICSTPGIDAIFVGPNDLSLSLSDGAAADPARPDVVRAMETVIRKCEAHGVVPAAFANTPEMAQTYRTMGFKFIAVAGDLAYLRSGSAAMLAAARAETAG